MMHLGWQADSSNRSPARGVAVQHHFHREQDSTEAHRTGAVVLAGKGWGKGDTGPGQHDL